MCIRDREYTWMGDQDATSWDDLSVNNESDARQGKYRAILKYKDCLLYTSRCV